MSEFFNKYEKYLSGNQVQSGSLTGCRKSCPTVVVLTFNIDDATVAEVNVVGPINCSVPIDGDPVTPFIQCLILQGFQLIAFTQGGIGSNFITYTFVDC